jgi:hypothetical protein
MSRNIVKGKFAFGDSLGFQVQIEDLHLKGSILGDDFKNKSSGRILRFLGNNFLPAQIYR